MERCIIYLLKNTINDKVYMGQTWTTPQERMRNGYTNSKHLLNAFKKYGKDKFYYEIIAVCSDQQTADYLEDLYIVEFDSIENGYNLKKGGSRGKLSLSTRKKMSEAHKGKKLSPERVAKLAEAKKGVPRKPETKRKLSLFFRKTTPEQDLEIIRLYDSKEKSKTELSIMFGVSTKTIYHIVRGIGRS